MVVFNNRGQVPITEEYRLLIDDYVNNCEDRYLIPYPEFCVTKLRLPEDLLLNIPPIENRERNQVISWIMRNLTYQQLLDAGW